MFFPMKYKKNIELLHQNEYICSLYFYNFLFTVNSEKLVLLEHIKKEAISKTNGW